MKFRHFAVVALPILMSSASFAAEPMGVHLEGVSGKVLVNQGKGFSAGLTNVSLKSGSKIMLGEDSTATLVFPQTKLHDACQVELKPSSVTRVAGHGMCDAQMGETQGLVEQPIITPTAGSGTPSSLPPEVVGLGFVAIVAGAAIYGVANNGDKPASGP
jgi:hypothetical protein